MESRYSATVVGLHYYKGTEGISVGAPVALRSAPRNNYDSNAVTVFRLDQTMIGHLRRINAAIFSALRRQRTQVNATKAADLSATPADAIREWRLTVVTQILEVLVKNSTNYLGILPQFRSYFKKINASNPDAEYSISVTSGTLKVLPNRQIESP